MSVKKNIFGDKQKMTVGGKGEVATSKYRVTKFGLAIYAYKPIIRDSFSNSKHCFQKKPKLSTIGPKDFLIWDTAHLKEL